MPSFKVEELEAVEYDLRPFADSHGTIPEPNEQKIRAFIRGIMGYVGEDLDEVATEEAAAEKLREEGSMKMFERMADNRPAANKAVAELCSDSPSEEDVAKLPFRVFMQFVFYLRDEVLSPEVLGGDSTPPSPGTASSSTGSSGGSTASPSPQQTPSEETSTPSSIAG